MPPWWLSGAGMGAGQRGSPRAGVQGMGVPGVPAARVSLEKGGKAGSVPVPCSSPGWGWICPVPQPTVSCRTRDRRSRPAAMTGVRPWLGSAPHGI